MDFNRVGLKRKFVVASLRLFGAARGVCRAPSNKIDRLIQRAVDPNLRHKSPTLICKCSQAGEYIFQARWSVNWNVSHGASTLIVTIIAYSNVSHNQKSYEMGKENS